MLDLLKKTRSYRRFKENVAIDESVLGSLVEAVRLSPSAGNLQRIRVAVINDREECREVFSTLSFAAYLSDWSGPSEGQRPSAYIVLLTETALDTNLSIDVGIAAQSILLAASSFGLGGCFFRSFSAEKLSAVIKRDGYKPALVIALGVPDEEIVITDVVEGDVKYYRDERDRHVVPKRQIKDIIV